MVTGSTVQLCIRHGLTNFVSIDDKVVCCQKCLEEAIELDEE